MTRRAILNAGIVAAVFLAGAFAGAAVDRLVSAGPGTPASVAGGRVEADETNPPSTSREGEERGRNPVYGLSRVLEEELDLTQEQRARVNGVLERRSRQAREIFQESRLRFRAHLDSTVAELTDFLSDDQADRFDDLIERIRERRRSSPRDVES